MHTTDQTIILQENHVLFSKCLEREVIIDFYLPADNPGVEQVELLLINDGQDLPKMDFNGILGNLFMQKLIEPLLCVGIHCGTDRKNEYGTAYIPDHKGRGSKAAAYTAFIFKELIPFIQDVFKVKMFHKKSFCGFSLGALSALDIVWNHPREFSKAGLFSGSFWWRSVSQRDENFDEDKHRIMHNLVRNGGYFPWLKFFFETGGMDESADRNNNGVIDSIDDTVSLIYELVFKGYDRERDIRYLEIADGKHDVPTWGRAFPDFLLWGWGQGEFMPENKRPFP